MPEELVTTLRASLLSAPAPGGALPLYVPWPFLLPTRLTQLGVVAFYSKSLSSLRCNHRSSPPSDRKVAFLISMLSGKALLCAKAIRDAQSVIMNSYEAFSNHFKEVFVSPLDGYPFKISSCDYVKVSPPLTTTLWSSARLLPPADGMRSRC